jgi:hypothetical protein
MSARPIFSKEAEPRRADSAGLSSHGPVLVTNRAVKAAAPGDERLLGAVGLIVITAILALGIYSVMKYLL